MKIENFSQRKLEYLFKQRHHPDFRTIKIDFTIIINNLERKGTIIKELDTNEHFFIFFNDKNFEFECYELDFKEKIILVCREKTEVFSLKGKQEFFSENRF